MTHLAYVCQDRGIPFEGAKGSSIHFRSMVRAFAQSDVDVDVISPRVPVNGVPELPSVSFHFLGSAANSADGVATLLDEIHRGAPIDAVYERLSLHADGASRWCGTAGVPHVLEVNAPLTDEAARFRKVDDPDGTRKIERAVIQGADLVLPVSPWIRRWLIEQGVDTNRARVLPNGVGEDWLRSQPLSNKEIDPGDKPLKVVFVGSLRPWHDLDTLLDAFELLPEDFFRLEIVGDGPGAMHIRQRLEDARLAEKVALCGAVPHDEVMRLIDSSDACVAPYSDSSDFYFCPIKVFEYGARRRPVVAADVPALREQFPEGSLVYYRRGGVPHLAETLERLRLDRGLQSRTAGRLHDFVSGHTWEAHARSVLEWAGLRSGEPIGEVQ